MNKTFSLYVICLRFLPYNPIVFLLESSIEDPCNDLTKLADLQGIASSKVKYLSLSGDNIPLAMALLETAFIRGQWLIFQNVDLVPFFLPILEKQINSKDKDDVHGDFRYVSKIVLSTK